MGLLNCKKKSRCPCNIVIKDDKRFKILILGNEGVGKSSLVSRYMDNSFPAELPGFRLWTSRISNGKTFCLYDSGGDEIFMNNEKETKLCEVI